MLYYFNQGRQTPNILFLHYPLSLEAHSYTCSARVVFHPQKADPYKKISAIRPPIYIFFYTRSVVNTIYVFHIFMINTPYKNTLFMIKNTGLK